MLWSELPYVIEDPKSPIASTPLKKRHTQAAENTRNTAKNNTQPSATDADNIYTDPGDGAA
jgi:hypothetical protein